MVSSPLWAELQHIAVFAAEPFSVEAVQVPADLLKGIFDLADRLSELAYFVESLRLDVLPLERRLEGLLQPVAGAVVPELALQQQSELVLGGGERGRHVDSAGSGVAEGASVVEEE